MGLSIGFILPEAWLYGFLWTVLAGNVYLGIAWAAVMWYPITWMAYHFDDVGQASIESHVYIAVANIAGVFVGASLMWAARLPVLFEARVLWPDAKPGEPRARAYQVFIIIATLLILIGYNYLIHTFPLASDSTQDLAGGLTLGFGVAILLIAFYLAATVGGSQRREERLNLKYLFVTAILVSTPAIFDFPHNRTDLTSYQIGAFYLPAIIVIYVLVYFYIGWVHFWAVDRDRGAYRRFGEIPAGRDRLANLAQIRHWVWVVGIVHFFGILTGWAVDAPTTSTTGEVLLAVGIYSIVVSVLLWVYSWSGRRPPAYAAVATEKPVGHRRGGVAP